VTGYMLCGALGMLIGGFWVAKAQRLERNIALALGSALVLLCLAAWSGWPLWLAMGLVMLAGVGSGLAGPARDMLVKRAAPPGATGRVYGTVYSGLDIGFALSAPLFGLVMDRHLPAGVLLGAAGFLGLALVAAQVVGRGSRR
jgi:FSR family fosmidomycin resistance protein-like MFS transporter